jgi:hypothetical protein
MRFIFVLFVFIVTSTAFSQGNLQFNRVVSLAQSFTGSYGGTSNVYSYTSGAIVVPIGKVWKIEKISVNGGNYGSGVRINNAHSLSISDTYIGPIWLKAGDEMKVYSSCYSCSSLAGSYFISVIEFNIVQ